MSNKLTILSIIILWSFIIGCDVNVDDGNYAKDVAGTYVITGIETQDGVVSPSGTDNLVISRVSDLSVNVVIDFSNPTATDITMENVALTSASGGDIDLDKSYTNATVTGYVNTNDVRLRIDYDDNTFVDLDGMK